MPISLNERVGFIYLGASPNTTDANYSLAMPYPTTAPFETSRMVDAGRNTNGAMVGRQVGRSMDKIALTWNTIACDKWWEMNRWFENGHFTFYCHYFNHNLGRWQTRLFYLSNIKTEPYMVDPDNGEPKFYRNASFSVIDCGVA